MNGVQCVADHEGGQPQPVQILQHQTRTIPRNRLDQVGGRVAVGGVEQALQGAQVVRPGLPQLRHRGGGLEAALCLHRVGLPQPAGQLGEGRHVLRRRPARPGRAHEDQRLHPLGREVGQPQRDGRAHRDAPRHETRHPLLIGKGQHVAGEAVERQGIGRPLRRAAVATALQRQPAHRQIRWEGFRHLRLVARQPMLEDHGRTAAEVTPVQDEAVTRQGVPRHRRALHPWFRTGCATGRPPPPPPRPPPGHASPAGRRTRPRAGRRRSGRSR